MSKQLYFYYSAMNAGKTTSLIQTAYNYIERNMNVVIFKPAVDDRDGLGPKGKIQDGLNMTTIMSRIGISLPAVSINDQDNLFAIIDRLKDQKTIHCVLIDEVQFIQPEQIYQLSDICDELNIPVLCYGLRTDYRGQLFAASAVLLGIADKLSEIKTVCHCGKKASLTLRFDNDIVIAEGNPVHIGDNDQFISVCRYHYKKSVAAGKLVFD